MIFHKVSIHVCSVHDSEHNRHLSISEALAQNFLYPKVTIILISESLKLICVFSHTKCMNNSENTLTYSFFFPLTFVFVAIHLCGHI